MSDKKTGNENTIRLKNSYFEALIVKEPEREPAYSRPFQALLTKNVFPGEYTPRYWLGRVFDKIFQELNAYQKEKQNILKLHVKKHEKDGQTVIKKPPHNRRKSDGVTRKWKKGDPIFLDNGQPDWIDFEAYLKEFTELQEIEVDLGIRPIAFDPEKGPDAVGQEMLLLIPLLAEPREESGKVVPFKKK